MALFVAVMDRITAGPMMHCFYGDFTKVFLTTEDFIQDITVVDFIPGYTTLDSMVVHFMQDLTTQDFIAADCIQGPTTQDYIAAVFTRDLTNEILLLKTI